MRVTTYIASLRQFRIWHRYVGASLSVFLIVSALTGILLGLKKNIDLLQPPTFSGQVNGSLGGWLPLGDLADVAVRALQEQRPDLADYAIDRMDVRPGKGIVKVLFERSYWEVQVDGSSGQVLSIARRHSDWIEAIHDGSIISDTFKLISMNLIGIGLVTLAVSGLWLWYGPGAVRKKKKQNL